MQVTEFTWARGQSEGGSTSKSIVPYLRMENNEKVGTGRKAVEYCDYDKGKEVLHFREVELLSKRLQLLEEESVLMKKAILAKLEERSELINEISRHLYTLQSHSRSSENEEVASFINAIQGASGSVGLLQILHQSQGTAATANRKVNLIALRD